MTAENARKRRFRAIILAYPAVLILISIGMNLLAFGITPLMPALPGPAVLQALSVAVILLAFNHTWLMTSTELTRLKYGMHATPEEWAAAGAARTDIEAEGWSELERRHKAHRNATENIVLFAALAMVFSLASPAPIAAWVWITGFAAARLGYTFSYLRGKDDMRGIFMSVSLLGLYGIATYLALGLLL